METHADFIIQFLDLITDLDLKFLCKDHRWLTWVISQKHPTHIGFLSGNVVQWFISLFPAHPSRAKWPH